MKKNSKSNKNNSSKRSPVVVVLGHVDHGKSSLLEAVKDLKITEREAGGITQHIGAYVVNHKGEDITFIDTPGHEAFFAIRSRGTKVADIAILVVAADEGIKAQTKEAIKHIKEADMPFIVAINKIDKKNISIDKIKQELSSENIFVESYGGDVPSVEVSAKERIGIEDLLEMIILLAEMEELKEKETETAEGVVIEVQRDNKRGVVATFLVKSGTLKKGDIVATRSSFGKIKTMEDFLGNDKKEAKTSMPIQVTGVKGCPSAGEEFKVFKKIDEAKKFTLKEAIESDEENIFDKDKNTLNIIIKADVVGSLEAIEESLKKIPQTEINIRIIRSDIGNISESDVECSRTSNAKIFGFRVVADKPSQKMALREDIEIYFFDIIYELIDSVKETAQEMLEDDIVKKELGTMNVLAMFKVQKNRHILGGKVISGEVKKGEMAEIIRNKEKIGDGKIINVKKEEKDMEKISENEECGILLESKEKIEEGDKIIIYREEKIKRKL